MWPDEVLSRPYPGNSPRTWSTVEWPTAPSLGPVGGGGGAETLAARPPRLKRSSLVPTYILWHEPSSFLHTISPGRNVTEAAASQAPEPPSSSATLHRASQRAHWRRRGSNHQPAPRLPDRASDSMGVTGASRRPSGGRCQHGREEAEKGKANWCWPGEWKGKLTPVKLSGCL